MLNRLRGQVVYECGPIDLAFDLGKGWRDKITPELEAMGMIVLDPLHKSTTFGLESDDQRPIRKILKEEGRYHELSLLMKEIRHVDMRMVDRADCLVIHLDLDIFSCGTMEELFWANRSKKPCLVFCKQGKKNIPDWIFGTIPSEMLFDDMSSLLQYLRQINTAEEIDTLGRWIFF